MKDLHEVAGLVNVGKNADGETEYIGTRAQWQRFSELEKEKDLPKPEDFIIHESKEDND